MDKMESNPNDDIHSKEGLNPEGVENKGKELLSGFQSNLLREGIPGLTRSVMGRLSRRSLKELHVAVVILCRPWIFHCGWNVGMKGSGT